MDKFKKIVEDLIKKEVSSKVEIGLPPEPHMGDYSLPCFVLAKELKKSPGEVAQDLACKIKLKKPVIKVDVAGPFLNFFIDPKERAKEVLRIILEEKDNYGKTKQKKQKIMIEYPSPNTNKPLHLGHVRNMFIGNSVSRILKFLGNDVIQANLNNDRGVHICKSMIAYKKFGKNQQPNKKTDHFVGDYYVMFNEKIKKNPDLEDEAAKMLQKWEEGDKDTRALWKLMNRWALEGFDETYKRLGLEFDKIYNESEIYDNGKEIIQDGLKKGVFRKEENGAIGVELERYKLPNKVLLRADGTSIYMTQDLYLAIKKFKDFKIDKSIYVVGSEQNMHFQQLFKIIELLGYKWTDQCFHLSYGMVNLPHGRMKSREGTVIDADDLIDEMILLAKLEIEKRHKELDVREVQKRSVKIGMGALRFFILKMDPNKDMTYHPEESISFEGETGPYVQYAFARINSIIKKYGKQVNLKPDYSSVGEEEDELIKMLSRYPDVVAEAGSHLKPSLIARYLLDLAQKFNEFYHSSPILQEKGEVRELRLILILCVQQVLKNGLILLGIESPDEM